MMLYAYNVCLSQLGKTCHDHDGIYNNNENKAEMYSQNVICLKG